MGNRYKIRDNSGIFFVTFTVVNWIDLFIRIPFKDCITDSLKFCVENKGLNVHAYVIMTSHIHAIISAKKDYDIVGIIRDFKKFTSKELIQLIKTIPESRREWMLNQFNFEANKNNRGQNYTLWKEGYFAKQIETISFMEEKLNYIHNNPVRAGFVSNPEDYVYSSARNYCGEQGVMEVEYLL